MSHPAPTPEPPYYAVIFSARQARDLTGYAEMAALVRRLAATSPGYLGLESVEEGGGEITVSYWRDLDSIASWRRDLDHAAAKRMGREHWYERYRVRIARVERAYDFEAGGGG